MELNMYFLFLILDYTSFGDMIAGLWSANLAYLAMIGFLFVL